MNKYKELEQKYFAKYETDKYDRYIEALWKDLGDIPIRFNSKNEEVLELDFHIWKKGISKWEIWKWFDEQHSKGVAKGLLKLED